MKNLISTIKGFDTEIKAFGITEIFFVEAELHITSVYTLPYYIIERLESFMS